MDNVGAASAAMRDYERERWEGVTRQLDDSARRHQETAVILERIKGQMDGHDARIKALEAEPAKSRATVNMWIAIAGVIVVLLVCGVGPLWSAILQYVAVHLLK